MAYHFTISFFSRNDKRKLPLMAKTMWNNSECYAKYQNHNKTKRSIDGQERQPLFGVAVFHMSRLTHVSITRLQKARCVFFAKFSALLCFLSLRNLSHPIHSMCAENIRPKRPSNIWKRNQISYYLTFEPPYMNRLPSIAKILWKFHLKRMSSYWDIKA